MISKGADCVTAMMTISEIDVGLDSGVESMRWAAAAAAGELVASRPWDVWRLVLRHGASEDEDTRAAVATCMLEHLLESHFDTFFPLIENHIRSGGILLGDTLRRCWKLGIAERPENAKRWDRLINDWRKIRSRCNEC